MYVIDICPYVSEEMDLAHICKSKDLNMQIYRMEYANLQHWICTFTQSNMTFYRVAYVWHIPLCRISYVIHIPSCRGWIASVAQALSSQSLDEGPSPLHWPSQVMHSTTLQLLFPTQTACGLFDLSSTSLALCAHWMQQCQWIATTIHQKTFPLI